MMGENNHIFLAGSDALVHLVEPMQKNIPQNLLGAVHLVRTYLMTDFSTPLPRHAPVHILDDPLHSPSCV